MTDMSVFESLIAQDVRDEVGPEESVDALAIAREARAYSTRWRFQSMLSALKFVVAGVIVALFGGLLLMGVLTTQRGDESVPAGAMASPSSASPPLGLSSQSAVTTGGTVSMTLEDIEGASGSRLVAILYEGVPPFVGGDTPMHGLGAFSADITSDPFSVTDTIREGSEWWRSTTNDPIVEVPAGIHTIMVFVSSHLGPYSQWVPGEPIDAGCVAHVTVEQGQPASVTVGMPSPDGSFTTFCEAPSVG